MKQIVKKYIKEIESNDITPKETKEIKNKPMSNVDIKYYYPHAKIIEVSKLGEYTHIDELLPRNGSYVILLYESSPHSGHWVLLAKYDGLIEYFDSYATITDKFGFKTSIDAPLSWVKDHENHALGNKPYLTSLLLNSGYPIVYNAFDFQHHSNNISTCGRWVCYRLKCIKDHNMSLLRFIRMVQAIKEKTGRTYDDLISELFSKI